MNLTRKSSVTRGRLKPEQCSEEGENKRVEPESVGQSLRSGLPEGSFQSWIRIGGIGLREVSVLKDVMGL